MEGLRVGIVQFAPGSDAGRNRDYLHVPLLGSAVADVVVLPEYSAFFHPVPAARAADRVLITEFMAANSRTLQDQDRDYSDWIEIYNASDELVPLYRDPKSDMPATQFNMKWVEAAGLVKFDFLGLKTLTVIQDAIRQIRAAGRPLHIAADGRQLYAPKPGAENDIGHIPLDDKATYELYAAAKTVLAECWTNELTATNVAREWAAAHWVYIFRRL